MMLKWFIFMMRPGEETARVENIWLITMEKGMGYVALETGGSVTSLTSRRWLGTKTYITHRCGWGNDFT